MDRSAATESNTSHKRPVPEEGQYRSRAKRAKYASTACNECKRCKVKCIRTDEDVGCQRCTTVKTPCVVAPTTIQSAREGNKARRESRSDEPYYQRLSKDIDGLRQQIAALTASVAALVETNARHSSSPRHSASTPRLTTAKSIDASPRKTNEFSSQPQFIGPTRSAFSFNIAETSISRMNISTDHDQQPEMETAAASRASSPDEDGRNVSTFSDKRADYLQDLPHDEIVRLLEIYHEEIACVHPIIDTKDLIRKASQILELADKSENLVASIDSVDRKDVHLMKIAIATALLHETHGKNEASDALIASVEIDVGVISLASTVELRDIQVMGMLSLYFCHTSEELYAWRAIGRAARQALEMGLHRKQSLVENFKDPEKREAALQIFWVIYELDRRWSFGTSLSFALDDRDIDPQLPEPGSQNPYLKAMVAFAKLCSKVWEALPPYSSSLQLIPSEKEEYLDFIAQNWLQALPQDLQYERSSEEARPRQLRRVRTLLYLRGNYVRTLVHRHHVLSPENVSMDVQNAQVVVGIAIDSIQVLVHLNETSDIYVREQSIYHYYLLSAVAVLLLAVCHAPRMFAETCRDPFVSALELVKGFSRYSTASRRLWKSVRGLMPVIKSLSSKAMDGAPHPKNLEDEHVHDSGLNNQVADASNDWGLNDPSLDIQLNGYVPETFDMSTELMDLYDLFGSAAVDQQGSQSSDFAFDGTGQQHSWDIGDIARHFQGLL